MAVGDPTISVGRRAQATLSAIETDQPNPALVAAIALAAQGNRIDLLAVLRQGRELRVAIVRGAAERRAAQVLRRQLAALPAVPGPRVPTGF
jgi:hypothetical protein